MAMMNTNSDKIMQAPPAGAMPMDPGAMATDGSGLAGTMQPEPEMQGGGGAVQQVMQALLDGAEPEDLLRQGVPIEVIKEAIQRLLAEAEAQEGASAGPVGYSDDDRIAI